MVIYGVLSRLVGKPSLSLQWEKCATGNVKENNAFGVLEVIVSDRFS
jgi:hypothetical protein